MRRHKMKLLFIYVVALLLSMNAMACIGHEGANCRDSLPTGDYDAMYTEIHGNGVYPTSFNPIAQHKANVFAADTDTMYDMAWQVNRNFRGAFMIAGMN